MNRTPRSTLTAGIVSAALVINWSDGNKEVMTNDLPEHLKEALEAYFEELDTHREEVGADYNFSGHTVKVKVDDASAGLLDYLVAMAVQEWNDEDRFMNTLGYVDTGDVDDEPYMPSSNDGQGFSLMREHFVSFRYAEKNSVVAWITSSYGERNGNEYSKCGDTVLQAAMRCLVASKLGDVIEVPAEILK